MLATELKGFYFFLIFTHLINSLKSTKRQKLLLKVVKRDKPARRGVM